MNKLNENAISENENVVFNKEVSTYMDMYLLYDSELKLVLRVVFCKNDIECSRLMSSFVNNPQCPYLDILDKVQLHKIGFYKEQTGEFIIEQKKVGKDSFLRTLKDYKKK